MLNEITGKIKREAKIFFLLGTAIFISVVLVRFLIIPQVNLLQSSLSQYKKVNNFISSETGYSRIINEIRKKNMLLEKRVSVMSGLPAESTPELSSYLEVVINKAKAFDIRFAKMEPKPEAQNRDFSLHPFVFDFITSYHSLGQFTSAIEKLPQMYMINRVYIEAIRGGKITVKMMITCYIPLEGR